MGLGSGIAAFVLTAGLVATAQEKYPTPVIVDRQAQLPMALLPPDVPGSWILRVRTRGGIMGVGLPEILVASDGRRDCAPEVPATPCVELPEATRRAFTDQVRRAAAEPWLITQPSLCRDCYSHHMVLTSRNGDGTTTTVRAEWDATTRGQLAASIVRLYDLAASAAQPLTR